MTWKKIGQIFDPPKNLSWMVSHAMMPTAEHIEGDLYRVYFSARDASNYSQAGYFVINIKQPHTILEVSQQPVLRSGNLGMFDEHGALPSWIVTHNNRKYLYYAGWYRTISVPFCNSIGLAYAEPGSVNWVKAGEGPVMTRSFYDPGFTASCCLLVENGIFRMWYLSCFKWEALPDGTPKHYYHLKYAESKNGIDWQRDGTICIDFKDSSEFSISRPSILKEPDGTYKMWYSYRGDHYRIGYAESRDGIKWTRMDDVAGLDVSPSGWDSEMIEYPNVFDHDGTRYMLYNGNRFGLTGAGLAVWQP